MRLILVLVLLLHANRSRLILVFVLLPIFFFKKNLDTIWELIFFDGKNDKPIVSLIIAHTIIVLDAWRMLHNSDRNYMIIFSQLLKCVCFCSSAIIWFSVENNERKTHNQIILLSLDDEIFFMMSMRVPSGTWCMRA